MAHKGLTQYQGSEIGNIGTGQNGWYIIYSTNVTHHAGAGTNSLTDRYYPDVKYWVGIKALGKVSSSATSTALAVARVTFKEDWKGGQASGESQANTDLYMQPGDQIMGAFTSITMNAASVAAQLLIYRG